MGEVVQVKDLDRPLKDAELGLVLGITRQAVGEHRQRGVLRDGGTGWQHILDYCAHIRELASGRSSDRTALDQAKTRQAEADAQLKELDYLERTGALVPVAEIEPLLGGWAASARSEMQNAIEKLIAGIESKHGISIESDFVEAITSSAYGAIAAYPGRLAGTADASGAALAAAGAHADAGVAGAELPPP
jgi:hypothetical protein